MNYNVVRKATSPAAVIIALAFCSALQAQEPIQTNRVAFDAGTTQRSALATVIRRSEIEAAGWTRISDLLEGAASTSFSSIDDFIYTAAGDRLPPSPVSSSAMPTWLVLIDGVPVKTALFGQQLLDFVPVNVAEIDSVRINRGPVILHGYSAPRGALEIFSRRHVRGLFSHLVYQLGDETGDPGPFGYTSLASPNVERIGPYMQVGGGYGTPRWGISAGWQRGAATTSDTNIRKRLPAEAVNDSTAYGYLHAYHVSARVSLGGGEHVLTLAHGHHTGLIFVPPRIREEAVNLTDKSLSLAGEWRSSASEPSASYLIERSSLDDSALEDPGRLKIPFTTGHERTLTMARAVVGERLNGSDFQLGSTLKQWDFERDHLKQKRLTERLFMSVSRMSRNAIDGTVNLAVTRANPYPRLPAATSVTNEDVSANITGDVSALVHYRASATTVMTVSAALLHPLSEETESWIDEQLFNRDSTMTVRNERKQHLSFSEAGADVRHHWQMLNFSAGITASHVRGWELNVLQAQALNQRQPLADTLNLHSASLAGVHFGVETDSSAKVAVRAQYSQSTPFSADSAMQTAFRSTAARQFSAQLSFLPFNHFRVATAALFTSGTEWAALTSFEQKTSPALSRVDLSAEKWMWQQRVRLQLIFRNILNRPERYHPLGAQWNLRTFVSMSITTGK